jgi:hypothetical protein
MSGNTVDYNSALFGGGLDIFGATQVNMSNDNINFNTAAGANPGGQVAGGGLCIVESNVSSSGDTVDSNTAQISGAGGAAGGGFYIVGINEPFSFNVSLSNDTVDYNTVIANSGGVAAGGGLEVIGGSLNLKMSNDFVEYNVAQGGSSSTSAGGNAYGAGMDFESGATVTLCTVTVEFNTATGGTGSPNGIGYGGGIYIGSGATVYIDTFTVNNTINNTDSSGLNGSTANIDGTYILQNC